MKTSHALLTPLVCLMTVQYPIVAHASASSDAIDKFHQTCDHALQTAKEGDQAIGSCKQGEIAEGVHKNQRTASVIYGAMTGVAVAMIFVENTGYGTAIAKNVCLGLSLGGAAKSFLDSSKLAKAGSEVVGEYASMVNTAVKGGTMLAGGMALKGMLLDGKSFSDVMNSVNTTAKNSVSSKTASGKKETGCLFTSIGLGVLTSGAIMAAVSARKALETATSTATSQINASAKTASFNLQNGKGPDAPNNRVAAPNNNVAAEFDCTKKSGNAVVQCLAKTNPEISALVNSPGALDNLNKALGQNVGDFAKNFKGDLDRDLNQYVANGMGMGGGGSFASALDATKKMGEKLGAPEAYKPGSFTSANNGAGGHKGGADPMEKMLADMMKQMADPGADGLGKDRDPASEISFNNQMELLSPEKIAERTDISLFDRAHYRMQKNVKNLEQLNWSARDH